MCCRHFATRLNGAPRPGTRLICVALAVRASMKARPRLVGTYLTWKKSREWWSVGGLVAGIYYRNGGQGIPRCKVGG